jgi:hypothetical protein
MLWSLSVMMMMWLKLWHLLPAATDAANVAKSVSGLI